ncbi:MAG TPA: LamB/YcsF family protein, partial [Acidimicrobiales bacterium]|nr:LamB/YcsF family protein [Acidimicrobiales bacterium]
VLYQVGALDAFVRATGLRLHHVKPHGALYTMALDDAHLSRAIVEAIGEYDPQLPLYTLAGSETWHAAEAAGIRPVAEFFADRPLRADGTVIMFDWQRYLQPSPEVVAARVRSLLTEGVVESVEGPPVQVHAETICIHADTPGAAEIGPAVRTAIASAGWQVSGELLAATRG